MSSKGTWNAPCVLKYTGSHLLAALLCATASVLAGAPDQECGERVSLAKLITDPETYHGKALWVVAHVTIDFENMTVCPSENETQAKNCLWLDIDDGPYNTDQDYARYQSKLQTWKRFNLQTVAIHAMFDKTLKGHFSMWPAGLGNVAEVSGHQGGWNFTANATAPRTVCVGELPVPKESSDHRWMRSGSLKLRNGDYDGAMADFSRAISLEPSNSGYYLIRANAKERKRDHAGATADYTRAIEFAREDKDVIYIVRAEAREQTGDLDGAIADYTRAIEINPKLADAYHGRGLAKQKKGDAKGAAADLARARQLTPAQSPP
ncbi:MAG: tetratricopeptide repeat protein [Sulfuricaulis sp.]|nr:tetratricopeptide repeat protein [Sulfuricaulis sp.]